jgi:hypothetical protein
MAFIVDRGTRQGGRAVSRASLAVLLLTAASAHGQALSPSAAAAVTATPPTTTAAPPAQPGAPAAAPGAAGTSGQPPAKPAAPAVPAMPQLSAPQTVSRPATKAAAPRARGKANHKKKKQKEAEAPRRPITGPVATYPGFRMLDGGGSRVFVNVSKKVVISEHKAQGRVTYRLQGVAAPVRTNRLPLLTSFFPTPVGRVQLVEQGNDVDLVIELRAPSEAKHRVVERGGTILLQVDFPRAENLAVQPPTSAGPDRPRATRTTQTTSLGGSTGY